MEQTTITIDVLLDTNKVPEKISWKAGDRSLPTKAMMLAFWDTADKAALRIDLWTKDMMVDEMADFFYQTLMTMADTYNRATKQQELVNEMKEYAQGFYKKFQEIQMKENKLD